MQAGCSLAEPPPLPEPEPVTLDAPPIREGVFTQQEAVATAELVTQAEALVADGRMEEALLLVGTVESDYQTSPGSSLALWLRAQALQALEDWEGAASAAESYGDRVTEDVTALGMAYLLRAEARRAGALPGGIEAVFEIPAAANEAELLGADTLATLWASGLATPELRDLVAEAPRHPRVLPAFIAELSVRRYLAGDEEEATTLANEALALDPGPGVRERATNVVEGRIDEELEIAAVVGGILPVSGSPALRRLAEEIGEGVEVALAVDEGEFSRPVRFVRVEDASQPDEMAAAVQTLEGEPVAGLLGPLRDASLAAAVRTRSSEVPVISPTARLLPEGARGVFSLNGIDPAAGQALAELVLAVGPRQVVAIHAASPEWEEEFQWFQQAYARGGGTVTRVLTYPPGATGFRDQMREVLQLRPEGLVLLLPPEDVELLAPQIAFYGVDELPGLAVFGNRSWTSAGVLENVQARSTEGVFAVTSWVEEGEFGPGWQAFVEAYEEHFRRSLRSPTPALGYDAARLLLRAAREGGGTPRGTLQAMERIEGFPGATGLLSIVDGRVHRSFSPVRIENRRPVLVSP